ncbi:carbohydrate ABC transporter permease [Pseudothermotoga sp.]
MAHTFYKMSVIIVILAAVFVSVIPIYWVLVTSFSLDVDLMKTSHSWFPPRPTVKNYRDALGIGQGMYSVASQVKVTLFNSTVISFSVTGITLILAIMAAYAIERLRVPLRGYVSFFVLLTQMLPPIILVIPIYLSLARFGMLDRKVSLTFIYIALNLPFAIWIISSYFRRLPISVEEAAIIDGCSHVRVLWNILVPMSKPAIFTSGIFVFLSAWNEFIIALVLTSSLKAKTLPISISEFMGRFYTNYPLMCAAGIVSMVPPIIFAALFQNFLIEGLAKGAVKE